MQTYLVAFTLNRPNADPAQVLQGIKSIAKGWMQYIPNVILIRSEESADAIAKRIYKLITNEDYLVVIKVTQEYQGWMPKDAWNWLNKKN